MRPTVAINTLITSRHTNSSLRKAMNSTPNVGIVITMIIITIMIIIIMIMIN